MDQWINQGKYALNWNRRSCHKFLANQVRLELFLLAYNLGNFMRRLALPEDIKHWWMTSLQTRMIKTSGRLVRHARRLVFRLTEVLVTEVLVTEVLVTEVLVTRKWWPGCWNGSAGFSRLLASLHRETRHG